MEIPDTNGAHTDAWPQRGLRMLDHLWLMIPFLAVPALLPFLTDGIPRSFDGRTHMLRVAALERAIRDGVWLPRWMPEMQLGHGYPLFNFYGPAAYYVAVALGLVGGSTQVGFVLTMALAILMGGLGMYFWARDVFGTQRSWAALVAAVAYLYAPYLLLNVYVRIRGRGARPGVTSVDPVVIPAHLAFRATGTILRRGSDLPGGARHGAWHHAALHGGNLARLYCGALAPARERRPTHEGSAALDVSCPGARDGAQRHCMASADCGKLLSDGRTF
ncbi:MAG: hypothetical protein IPK16_21605 [Anaerolineales bacterium]|nr:hypothetical protein [Anaerolineales bacterium]